MNKTRLHGITRYIFEAPEAITEDYESLRLKIVDRLMLVLQKANEALIFQKERCARAERKP